MKRIHMIIHGRVQGVFYREHTMNMARKIGGITGYVKNLPDGTVEVIAEGEDKQLQILIKECRKGSFQSYVKDIDIKYEESTGEYDGFYAEF